MTVGGCTTACLVDDTKAAYTGSWSISTGSQFYGGSKHYSATVGNLAKYTFSGTKVSWIGGTGTVGGKVGVYVDNVLKTTVNLYSTTGADQLTLYTSPVLASGTHTLKLKLTSGKRINVDAFKVTSDDQ